MLVRFGFPFNLCLLFIEPGDSAFRFIPQSTPASGTSLSLLRGFSFVFLPLCACAARARLHLHVSGAFVVLQGGRLSVSADSKCNEFNPSSNLT